MKIKEIEQLFGVPPSTLADWKNPKHLKNHLATLLINISKEDALELLNKPVKHKNKAPVMLLSTINCSIGNESKHLKSLDIKNILSGKQLNTPIAKYVLKTIKNEASKKEIDDFIMFYKISKEKAHKIIYG